MKALLDKFKKYLPTIKSAKQTTPLKQLWPYIESRELMKWDCQTVARGVGAGFAGAVIPGFQLLYATGLALVVRGNLSVALICTLITNPLTAVPMVYLTSRVGHIVIANGDAPTVLKSFRWDFSSWHAFWSNFSAWLFQFGKSFFIGLPIVSLAFGVIGYFGTLLIWKGVGYFKKNGKKS